MGDHFKQHSFDWEILPERSILLGPQWWYLFWKSQWALSSQHIIWHWAGWIAPYLRHRIMQFGLRWRERSTTIIMNKNLNISNIKKEFFKRFYVKNLFSFLLLLFDPFPCVLTAEPLPLPLADFFASGSLPVCGPWSDISSLWWWHYWSLPCAAAAVCWGQGILSTVVSRLKSTWQVK